MSMDFYASKKHDDGVFGPVFSFDDDATTVNVSNNNAELLVRILGYQVEEGCFTAPIREFIARAKCWLADNIQPTPMTPHVIEEEPGRASFFHHGLPEGYLQRQIQRLLDLAVRGESAGATEMFAG